MTENEWKKEMFKKNKQLKHPSKGWITIAQDQITRKSESFEIKHEEMRDGSTLLHSTLCSEDCWAPQLALTGSEQALVVSVFILAQAPGKQIFHSLLKV